MTETQNILLGIGVAVVAFERLASLVKSFKTNGNNQEVLLFTINRLCDKIDLLVETLKHRKVI